MSNQRDRFLLSFFSKTANLIKHLSLWLAGVFLLINLVDILVSIFFRYFLHKSLIWTEEVARYTLIWAVMFAAPAALSCGEHVSINIIVERIPDLIARPVKWLKNILIIGVLLFFTYLGIAHTVEAWRFRTLALGIPRAIPLLILPLGMGLMAIQYILLELISIFKYRVDEGGAR